MGMGMGSMAAGRKLGPRAYGYQKKQGETLVMLIAVLYTRPVCVWRLACSLVNLLFRP